MKTTITVPNPLHEAAEQLAQRLDVSLSELYAIALSAYVTAHQPDDITESLNRVYAETSSAMDAVLIDLQVASIGGNEW